jgi:hypothetical protein
MYLWVVSPNSDELVDQFLTLWLTIVTLDLHTVLQRKFHTSLYNSNSAPYTVWCVTISKERTTFHAHIREKTKALQMRELFFVNIFNTTLCSTRKLTRVVLKIC